MTTLIYNTSNNTYSVMIYQTKETKREESRIICLDFSKMVYFYMNQKCGIYTTKFNTITCMKLFILLF